MPLSPEQLALRQKGLGGSEIAAVAGIHPYRTKLDVYLEKIGLRELVENRYTEWGYRLENALGLAYADRLKLPPLDAALGSAVLDQPGTLIHRTHPWVLATPDFTLPSGEEPRGLECKVRGVYDSHRWGPDGTDEVPDEVAAQCHWGMLVTGYQRWDVAVLLGGNDFRVYTLRYDPEIAKHLLNLGHAFWFDHVVAEKPPSMDGSKSAQHFVKRLFPMHDDAMKLATPELDELCDQLRKARTAREEAEALEMMYEARVKAQIGVHSGIVGRDYKITWKNTKASEKTNWEMVAKGLLNQLPPDQRKALVSIQTNEVPGSRRFLVNFPGGKDDA